MSASFAIGVILMNIVLEGPDASGKSTLASHIQLLINWPIKSTEGPEKFPGEVDERIRRYLTMDNMIFDRHPVISQPIYNRFNGTSSVDPILTRQFYNTDPLIIYCARDSKSFPDHHVIKSHDTNEHIKSIKKHDGEIIQLYEDWAMQHAQFIYRIGDTTSALDRLVLRDMVDDIAQFHEKFGLEYNGKPRLLPYRLQEFRSKFMSEELSEYNLAITAGNHESQLDLLSRDEITSDLEKALDALVDLVYVALGTSYMHGFNFREAWRRVHSANMKKIRVERADQSSRGSLFDVIKPPGWRPPSHTDLVEDHQHIE
jgi:predicted HAD superfamily Cof-like phosphohydrolase